MTGYPSRTLLFDWIPSLNFIELRNVLTGLYCITWYILPWLELHDWTLSLTLFLWLDFVKWLDILWGHCCITEYPLWIVLYCLIYFLDWTVWYPSTVFASISCIAVWLNFSPRLCCGVLEFCGFLKNGWNAGHDRPQGPPATLWPNSGTHLTLGQSAPSS